MVKKIDKQKKDKQLEKIYLDPKFSLKERVKKLLSLMTLEEKMAQLGSAWIYEILDNKKFSHPKAEKVMKNGIGQISRLGGASNFSPEESLKVANQIQRFLLEKTRLGIPAIIHEESCCGYMAKGATCFPQIIGVASTWEPELAREMGEVIRKQMKTVGVHQTLAPVLDIVRDARWGRVEETFGEDPYLVSLLGLSYIKGIQGDNTKVGIMATAKHFVGHGVSEGGMNWAPPHISPREMREVFLFPFEVAVKEGKISAIMPGYHELDGVPCHNSRELLINILRKEWGFKGLVVSDYFAIDMLQRTHLISRNKEEAAKQALEAGVDIELPSTDCYGNPLRRLWQKGLINEALIDESVTRILEKKFLLGLFENPYIEAKESIVFDTPEQRSLARKIAQKSIVLLKNKNNTLPIKKDIRSIAVVGPNAHSIRNMVGDYAYPCHIESLRDMKKDDQFFDTPMPDKVERVKNFIPITTVLEGIKEKVSKKTAVFYAQGCEVRSDSREGFSEAIAMAKKSEIAIVVVGDKSGLVEDCTSGETRDRADLKLPGVQEELVKEIYKTGTPVIVVLINGRPLSINWIRENIPAIIEAWLPGEEGGRAIADVLFGDFNPGGKLPISFPRSVGQVPIYYNHKPSGGRSHWRGDYVEISSKPLFPFGYGLSYTSFKYSNLVITPKTVSWDSQVEISVEIQNTGKCPGEEVVQLYINDELAEATRPIKELKGFKRVILQPNEKKKVKFFLAITQLGFYNRVMKYIVETGVIRVMVGSSSEDIRLKGKFKIIGETQEIKKIRRYFTIVRVE